MSGSSEAPAASVEAEVARPRQARDWRSIATELGIVVFGVLIALGAQQLVEVIRTRSDIAEFRAALNVELAGNLGAYQGRIAQSACLTRRLDQLEQWQRDWRDGDGPAIDGTIGRPLAYRRGTSVWQTGAASIATRMALKERLAFAELYDGIEVYELLGGREIATWHALYAYDGARQLSPPEVKALRGLLISARSTDRSLQSNWPDLVSQAATLGIRSQPKSEEMGQGSGLCDPLRLSR